MRTAVACLICAATFGIILEQCCSIPLGRYEVQFESFTDEGLEPLSGIKRRTVQVFWPLNASLGERLPLLVFAHGAAGGGVDMEIYGKHLRSVASFGFVVIAPSSCFMGCSPPKTLSRDTAWPGPDSCYPLWPSFVYENIRAIHFAKNQSLTAAKWASKIDWGSGIGAFGHSMGGEAIVQLAGKLFGSKYNVKAMVCEHCFPCIETGAVIGTPALFFTGNKDDIVTPQQVMAAYTADTIRPKTFANAKGRGHLEMANLPWQYNPAISWQTAAFMKTWLNNDSGYFHDLVYGRGPDSVCGYAGMVTCEHDFGNSSAASVLV